MILGLIFLWNLLFDDDDEDTKELVVKPQNEIVAVSPKEGSFEEATSEVVDSAKKLLNSLKEDLGDLTVEVKEEFESLKVEISEDLDSKKEDGEEVDTTQDKQPPTEEVAEKEIEVDHIEPLENDLEEDPKEKVMKKL